MITIDQSILVAYIAQLYGTVLCTLSEKNMLSQQLFFSMFNVTFFGQENNLGLFQIQKDGTK